MDHSFQNECIQLAVFCFQITRGVDGLTFRMPTNRATLFPVIIFQI